MAVMFLPHMLDFYGILKKKEKRKRRKKEVNMRMVSLPIITHLCQLCPDPWC